MGVVGVTPPAAAVCLTGFILLVLYVSRFVSISFCPLLFVFPPLEILYNGNINIKLDVYIYKNNPV